MDRNEFIKNFSSLFEDTPINDFEADTRFRDLEEWDSMIALTVMAMVNEKYKVKLSPIEIKQATTIQELFDLVISKK
jgi:acyl carrier protein